MSKYTKEKWEMVEPRYADQLSIDAGGKEIADVYGKDDVAQANAKLILCAPEMVEMLLTLKERHYNPFEPNNQSDSYKGIVEILEKAGRLR